MKQLLYIVKMFLQWRKLSKIYCEYQSKNWHSEYRKVATKLQEICIQIAANVHSKSKKFALMLKKCTQIVATLHSKWRKCALVMHTLALKFMQAICLYPAEICTQNARNVHLNSKKFAFRQQEKVNQCSFVAWEIKNPQFNCIFAWNSTAE